MHLLAYELRSSILRNIPHLSLHFHLLPTRRKRGAIPRLLNTFPCGGEGQLCVYFTLRIQKLSVHCPQSLPFYVCQLVLETNIHIHKGKVKFSLEQTRRPRGGEDV